MDSTRKNFNKDIEVIYDLVCLLEDLGLADPEDEIHYFNLWFSV